MDGGCGILIGGSADDARSGWSRKFTTSLWEGFSGASRGVQTASPKNQHATRFRVARQLSEGAGVRRKPEDQPRLDWRTQGTEVGGRQAAGVSRRCGSQPKSGNWSPALPKDATTGVSQGLNRRRCHKHVACGASRKLHCGRARCAARDESWSWSLVRAEGGKTAQAESPLEARPESAAEGASRKLKRWL